MKKTIVTYGRDVKIGDNGWGYPRGSAQYSVEREAFEIVKDIHGVSRYKNIDFIPSLGQGYDWLAHLKNSKINPFKIVDIHGGISLGGFSLFTYLLYSNAAEEFFLPIIKSLDLRAAHPSGIYGIVTLCHKPDVLILPEPKVQGAKWVAEQELEGTKDIRDLGLDSVLLVIEVIKPNFAYHSGALVKFFDALEERLDSIED